MLNTQNHPQGEETDSRRKRLDSRERPSDFSRGCIAERLDITCTAAVCGLYDAPTAGSDMLSGDGVVDYRG